MVIARLSLQRIALALPVMQQGRGVPADQLLLNPIGEPLRVAGIDGEAHRSQLPIAQVVGDIACRHDQPVLLSQWHQGLAHAEGVSRAAVMLNRERNNRHIGLREQEAQRHPSTVIKTALTVRAGRHSSCLQNSYHLLRALG